MPNQLKAPTSLLATVKDAYSKFRNFIIYAIVIGLSLSPLIPIPGYKVALLVPLGLTLLYLLFDIETRLQLRLASIESCVLVPKAPHYNDFRAAEDEIYRSIESALVEAPGVDLHFLTVSGSYSWAFFEDTVRRLDAKFNSSKQIVVTFCLIEPSHFDEWSLHNWKRKAQATIGSIEAFKRRYSARIEKRQLIVDAFRFDNIPHWHGILINGATLFLGRTEWEFCTDGSNAPADLLVGQIEYRQFHKSDRFGGEERIERFKNWVDRYKLRHEELTKPSDGTSI